MIHENLLLHKDTKKQKARKIFIPHHLFIKPTPHLEVVNNKAKNSTFNLPFPTELYFRILNSPNWWKTAQFYQMSANAEAMTELGKWYLTNPSEVTDSGKNY